MAILRICATEGCETKTLGEQCLEHELAPPVLRRHDLETLRTPELATAAD
jgi:hypothetical protein